MKAGTFFLVFVDYSEVLSTGLLVIYSSSDPQFEENTRLLSLDPLILSFFYLSIPLKLVDWFIDFDVWLSDVWLILSISFFMPSGIL